MEEKMLSIFRKVGNFSKYEAGKFIFNEGEDANEVYILIKGEVEILKNDGKNSLNIINTVKAIDIFGEMAVFLNNKRAASVRAKTDIEVLSFPQKAFLQAVSKVPKFNLSVMTTLIDRLNHINNEYVNLIEYKYISALIFFILDNYLLKNIDNIKLNLSDVNNLKLTQQEILKGLFILEKNDAIFAFDTENLPLISFKIDRPKFLTFIRNKLNN